MHRLLLILLLTVPVLRAQQPPLPGVVPPRPGEPGDAPPAVVDRGRPDPEAIQTPPGGRWELLNSNGQDVGLLYATLTGKRVLVSSSAAQAEMSLIQPGPLTNREAAVLLEKKLLMEGFALISSGDNEVKLVLAAGQNASAKTENQRVIGSVDEIEDATDEFITYVMPLEYLKPDEAVRAFQQVVGQFGPAGTVAPVPNAASVVISGNSPLVRMLIELKNRIDVPSARVDKKFVTVEFADVEDLAERLNEIFNEQSQQSQTAAVQRTPTPSAPPIPGAAAGAGSSSAGEETPINIIPDPRTNRIFLLGRPVDIVFVESLIEEFDQPSSSRNFLRHKLRYLPVGEFLPVASDALERTISGTGSGGGGRTSGSRSSGSTRTTGGTTSRTSSRNTGSTTGGSGVSAGSRASGVSQTEINTAPESILVGKTLLVADNISNSIVVQGPPHHVEIVERLIEELDQPSEQIAITAVFGRYDLSDSTSFGVDMAQLLKDVTGELTIGGTLRNGIAGVIDPSGGIGDFPTLRGAGGSGLNVYGLLDDEFAFFVNALESNSNFTALARPTVFTTNNNTARISSGSRIAVPTSSFQSGTTGGLSTNVEYRDIVLELEVRPLVNSANEVTLEIALVRDSTGLDRNFGGEDGFSVPDIDTDEINTIVTVANRSTIVLGGLITEEDRDSRSGIPILSSIPGIGKLFSTTSTSVDRNELVILLHPTIISTQSQLDAYQREFDSDNTVGPRARSSVSTGVLPERRPWPAAAPLDDKGRPTAATPAGARPGRAEPLAEPSLNQALRDRKKRLNYNRRR